VILEIEIGFEIGVDHHFPEIEIEIGFAIDSAHCCLVIGIGFETDFGSLHIQEHCMASHKQKSLG